LINELLLSIYVKCFPFNVFTPQLSIALFPFTNVNVR